MGRDAATARLGAWTGAEGGRGPLFRVLCARNRLLANPVANVSLAGFRFQLSRRGCAAHITARRASSFMAYSLASGCPGPSGSLARVGFAT